MAYSYPAFFDVDKTLLRINSGTTFITSSTREGFLGIHNLLEALLLAGMYKLKVVSAEVTIHRLARWFKGKEEKEIEEFTKELYDTRLKPKIRPGALDILTYHRERGAELILLTASTPYTCVPMIKDLDLHHCLCSEMEVVQGYFSGKPLMPYCYGPEKKTRASEFCQSRGYDLASAWYYGDSHADIHIMEAVGNAVCVNPDKKLQAAAKSRGWKIVSW